MNRLTLVLSLLISTGCSSVRIVNLPDAPAGLVYEENLDGWFGGFWGDRVIDVAGACPGEAVKEIRNYTSVEDFLITLVTIGIYVPRTAKIICAKESANAANP
jgi:hypothetical protein